MQNSQYKDTPIGKIPADWEVKRLGELGNFSKGRGILKDQVKDRGLPCIRYGEIYTSYDYVTHEFKSFIDEEVAKESKEIKKGDVLFAGSGETVDEIGKSVAYIGEQTAYAGGDVIVFTPNQDLVSSDSLSYTLDLDIIRKQKRYMGQGNSVVHIYPSDLAKIQLPLPPLPEQQRIAEVLSTWDQAIQYTEQLIRQKEQRKKWLMQKLLTGKIRLKGFSGEWKEYKLGDFIKESRIPSKCNDVNRRITVKLNLKGIEKREVRGSEAEDATIFFIRKKGQFIYGKQNIHKGAFGIIPDELDGFESSQDIPSFDFNDNVIPEFFLKFMSQESFYKSLEKISTGTGSKRVHPENLYKVKVKFPHLQEQTAIAEVLQAADEEIELLKAKAEKLKEQKEGLMQQLLTGKKRLNLNLQD